MPWLATDTFSALWRRCIPAFTLLRWRSSFKLCFDSLIAGGRKFPAIVFPDDFCRVAVLHDRRQHRLRIPPTPAARYPSISHVGLSFRSIVLRGSCCASSGLHFQERLAELRLWTTPHSGRDSCVCLFLAAAKSLCSGSGKIAEFVRFEELRLEAPSSFQLRIRTT